MSSSHFASFFNIKSKTVKHSHQTIKHRRFTVLKTCECPWPWQTLNCGGVTYSTRPTNPRIRMPQSTQNPAGTPRTGATVNTGVFFLWSDVAQTILSGGPLLCIYKVFNIIPMQYTYYSKYSVCSSLISSHHHHWAYQPIFLTNLGLAYPT